jgi:hypothetical protein
LGLTESKLKDLIDKKFDKLYEKHEKEWVTIANNAFAAARDHICEGNTPRPDDVLKMLACLRYSSRHPRILFADMDA